MPLKSEKSIQNTRKSTQLERAKIDKLWAAESEERIDAFEKDEISSVSAEKVFEKIGLNG